MVYSSLIIQGDEFCNISDSNRDLFSHFCKKGHLIVLETV